MIVLFLVCFFFPLFFERYQSEYHCYSKCLALVVSRGVSRHAMLPVSGARQSVVVEMGRVH